MPTKYSKLYQTKKKIYVNIFSYFFDVLGIFDRDFLSKKDSSTNHYF